MAIEPALKAQWLYELRLNGFVVFPNFLPRDLVEAMLEQFQPILNGEVARLRSGDETSLRGRNRLSFDIAAYVDRLKGPLDDDRFRRNPVIEELVTGVLGRWRYGVTKAEVPLKDTATMTWHPDVPNDAPADAGQPIRPVRLTFNVPLVDINHANGPMEIVPGSHRMCHYETYDHLARIPRLHAVPLLLRVGDAVLRDGNALHRGTANLTDEPRILLDQTYRAL